MTVIQDTNKYLWVIAPILYLTCLNFYCAKPYYFNKLDSRNFTQVSLSKLSKLAKPMIPTNPEVIWKLAQMSQNVNAVVHDPTTILQDASILIDWNFTNLDEFNNFTSRVMEHMTHSNESFINVIWGKNILINGIAIIGIIGMMFTLYPAMRAALSYISKDLYDFVVKLVNDFRSIIELFGYLLSFIIIAWSFHMEESRGTLISFIGTAIFMISFFMAERHNTRLLDTIRFSMYILIFLPLAIFYNSQIYGFLAILSLYVTISISKIVDDICIYIREERHDNIYKLIFTSLIMSSIYGTLKIYNMYRQFIVPTYLLGVIGYFVVQSLLEFENNKKLSLELPLSLIIVYLAKLHGVAVVFGGIYVLIRISMLSRNVTAILYFVISLILYKVGTILNANPELIYELAP